ncbi:Asp23/Gls24 family envelope stress response protein [soil metagenome]|nr:Asp23/Gls24 family envelope stress response protein [Rubrobacteraceae bacterium]MDQ3436784.1 Asp23/Gls24 family envelope stress response protein [Actinomycetota bacterium]
MAKKQKQHEGGEKLGGDVRIEDTVVSKLAGLAAGEVEGVHMGGGASRAVGGILEGVAGGGSQIRGVSVEVGEKEVAVDLTLALDYGKSVPRITESVRRNIIDRVENLAGLRVAEVNITVNDVIVPDPSEDQRRLEGPR